MPQRDLFVDAFELPSTTYEIHEAASVDDSPNAGVVDGENVLARVVGPFFLVDGKSRNGRFYTRELWEKAIKRTNDRLGTGQMLGTIGHSQSLDDAALLQGLASHRVARLWIDEKAGVGMGEILVLNTPSGQILNAYLRGGVQFPVSSRGYGGFRQEKRDGAPVIDEDSFELETFDFVRVPGVAIAVPLLVESLDTEAAKLHGELLDESSNGELYNERQTVPKSNLEDREMSEETAATIAALARQKAQVETDLTAAYADNEQLRSKNESLEAEGSKLKGQIGDLTGQLAESKAAGVELETYKALGTVAAIQEVFERFRDMNTQNKALAGVASANESLNEELAAYRELGTVEELNKAMDIAERLLEGADETVTGAVALEEQLSGLGTVAEITAALDLLEVYTKMATPAELETAAGLLETYIELGTVSEVEELVERTTMLAEALAAQKRQAQVEALAKEVGAPADVVSDLLESFGEEGTRDMLARLGHVAAPIAEESAGDVAALAAVAEDTTEEAAEDAAEGDDLTEAYTELSEEVVAKPAMSRAGSLTMSLMEQFNACAEETVELGESDDTVPTIPARRVGLLMESCSN